MICEMCGKEVPVTKPVFIEGSRLDVCPNCAKFGDENRGNAPSKGAAPAPSAQVIEQRLQKREKRMQTKDVYAGTETVELVDDYGGKIRDARVARGMDMDKFAASISEKKGTLAKIEANDLIPDDKLLKKLEKALDISLRETVSSGGSIGGGASGNKMTLSNFIRKG
jgi:putative transcription factor